MTDRDPHEPSPRIPSLTAAAQPGGEDGHTPGDSALEQAGTHPLGVAAGALGGAMAGAVMGIAAGPVGSLAGAVAGGIAGAAMGSGQLSDAPVTGPNVSATPTEADASRAASGETIGEDVVHRPLGEGDEPAVGNDDEDLGLPEEGFPPRVRDPRNNASDDALRSRSPRDVPSLHATASTGRDGERPSGSDDPPAAREPRADDAPDRFDR